MRKGKVIAVGAAWAIALLAAWAFCAACRDLEDFEDPCRWPRGDGDGDVR